MACVRLKFGKNKYMNKFTCAVCRQRFAGGGLIAYLEFEGKIINIPVCESCVDKYGLFEGDINLDRDDLSHPIGVA